MKFTGQVGYGEDMVYFDAIVFNRCPRILQVTLLVSQTRHKTFKLYLVTLQQFSTYSSEIAHDPWTEQYFQQLQARYSLMMWSTTKKNLSICTVLLVSPGATVSLPNWCQSLSISTGSTPLPTIYKGTLASLWYTFMVDDQLCSAIFNPFPIFFPWGVLITSFAPKQCVAFVLISFSCELYVSYHLELNW